MDTFKTAQYLDISSDGTLLVMEIKLYHFVTCHIACILYFAAHFRMALNPDDGRRNLQVGVGKGSVAQAIAERI